MARKVILDVDTGVDDALALLLALRSPELEVVGVTCVAGNVTIDLVTRNTLAVLEVAGSHAPVAVGARKPLMAPLRTATYFHGLTGLGGIELPRPRRLPLDEDAPSFLTRRVRERQGEITVIAVGPLTNIALAVLLDPKFAANVAELVVMGGSVAHPGNATSAAEANFSNDPEAAAAVVQSGAALRLVDLGATHQAVLPMDAVVDQKAPSPVAALALDLLRFYGPICVSAGAAGAVLHDPLAVGLATRPDLAAFVPLHLAVETAGTYSRGASIGNFSGFEALVQPAGDHLDCIGLRPLTPNALVAREINSSAFLHEFLERLELA